jgi:hypothetical protein
MSASRIDDLTDPQPLLRLGAALFAVGVVVMAAMSSGLPWWLWLPGAAILLVCALGLFVVSSRWFTREYPVLSLHGDRIAYRGFRDQVIMLRNLGAAQFGERRLLGVPIPVLELELRDAEEPVVLPLWAVVVAPEDLIAQIEARVVALERDRVPG